MTESAFTPFAVGAYRCIQRLGAGRSGELFAAVHGPSGTPRALRRLAPEIVRDETLCNAVLANIEWMRRMEHPNVVPIHEVLERDRDLFVVSDYVQGPDLLRALTHLGKTGPLSVHAATLVCLQICRALDHARKLRVEGEPAAPVHGALSPTNVLLGFQGDVQLTDFGAWKIPTGPDSDGYERSARIRLGYCSPEHVNGSAPGGASDIFCIGILLHEMVTGRSPFLAPSPAETLEMVEQAGLGPDEDLPAALTPVLRRCLARAPTERISEPAALLAELIDAVPGAGSPEIRDELASFISGVADAEPDDDGQLDTVRSAGRLQPAAVAGLVDDDDDEEATAHDGDDEEATANDAQRPPVAMRPPEDSPPALPRPAGNLLHGLSDAEEPTDINPAGVMEALAALSSGSGAPAATDATLPADSG